MTTPTQSIASQISLLAEGVAILMFIACVLLWAGIATGRI